jgi:hypothetical protein
MARLVRQDHRGHKERQDQRDHKVRWGHKVRLDQGLAM